MTPARWQHIREILYGASQIEPTERPAYLGDQCAGDETLRAEVEELLCALEESGGFLESPPRLLAGDLPETHIGPYRILEEAARGGMGVVYRALRDGDYHQIVAIKLVRAELASEALTGRFRVERQTLAMLNHPNIARLMDGGTTGSGRPYLVMEWVDGSPVHQYAREHGLSTRQRLELFLQVCDAVAHAHRNLVVHRDLKPSNILITADGQPKLLDFGIARVFTTEETAHEPNQTISGVQPFTPEYASPEQVRQERVTTATDVYSLGAVLYEVLTGVPAHRLASHAAAAVERAVCVDVPPLASTVTGESGVSSKELRGDLDTVLAKALEKDPARRYAHVDEFAADIRRHLDGQPVSARRASFAYRASRFAKRNKLAVAAAALVVLALAAGLTIALWQARRARAEREIAEQRFEMARQLAGAVLYEFHDGIRDLQGSLPMRQLLLTRSLEYLDKLAAGAGANPALQRDLANGYERVAELTGGGGISNLGRDQAGLQSLRKALELRQQVLASDPHSIEFRRDLARTHRKFVSLNGIGASESLEHAKIAAAIVEALVSEKPADAKIREDLAASEYAMGASLTQLARYPEAAGYYRKAIAHASGAPPENMALYHKHLGAVLIKVGDLLEALHEYRAALVIDESRTADIADAKAKLDLSFDYTDIALILNRLGRLSDSLDEYNKAYRLRSEVAAADPKDARAGWSLASVAWRRAHLVVQMSTRREGERAFDHAIRLAESYHERFPERRDGMILLADATQDYGSFYLDTWHACNHGRPLLQRALGLYRVLEAPKQVEMTEGFLRACDAQLRAAAK